MAAYRMAHDVVWEIVLLPLCDREGHLATRADVAEEDVSEGVAALLPWIASENDALDLWVVDLQSVPETSANNSPIPP